MTDLKTDELTKRLYETLDALDAQDVDVDYLLVNLLSKNVSKEPNEAAGLLSFVMKKAAELPDDQVITFAGSITTIGAGILANALPREKFTFVLQAIIERVEKAQ